MQQRQLLPTLQNTWRRTGYQVWRRPARERHRSGFFLTEQNRTLLTNPDGSLTDRSRTILAHTPFGRFGEPEDLYGTIHYLISDASNFVTGTVAVIDGGFDAFSI